MGNPIFGKRKVKKAPGEYSSRKAALIAAWQDAHPDKMREYRKRYDEANREKRKAQKRACWNAHKYGTKSRPEWADRNVGNKGQRRRYV